MQPNAMLSQRFRIYGGATNNIAAGEPTTMLLRLSRLRGAGSSMQAGTACDTARVDLYRY